MRERDSEVRVHTADGVIWSRHLEGHEASGTSVRDEDALTLVVFAVSETLQQAQAELALMTRML